MVLNAIIQFILMLSKVLGFQGKSCARRGLSIFVRPEQIRTPNFQRQRPPAVQDVVVCVGPNCQTSITALKSVCGGLGGEDQSVSIEAIHVSKDWRRDPSVGNLLRTVEEVSANVKVNLVDSASSVQEPIIHNIHASQPDLIVIGGQDSSTATRIFGTLQYVVKNSPCHVLVVRDDAIITGGLIKALVCFGVNDWEGSIDAFRAALSMARPGDCIEAVHVVYAGTGIDAAHGPPMVAPKGNGSVGAKISKALEDAMIEALEDDSTCLTWSDVNIRPVVLHAGIDNPVKVLMDYAADINCNLLSVGVGSIGRVFTPINFSYSLTHTSPCSVLVARKTLKARVDTASCNFYVEDLTEWVRNKSFI